MKYIVDFKNDALEDQVLDYLNSNSCTVIQRWNNFDKSYLVESASCPPTTEIIEFVLEDSPMKIKPLSTIEVNRYWGRHEDPTAEKIVVDVQNQKDWWKNYCYITPEFDKPTLTLSRLGKGINVYVMDSGINTSHIEFAEANIVDLYTVTPGDFRDKKGHGTAIASVIVGKECGITSATIKNVKIFEPGYNTLQSEMLGALDSILEDHEDTTFSILNCSWIIDKNPWVEYKLKQLIDEGVWVICAAGNNGTVIENVTPAAMSEALTIGAYNQELKPCDFSNYTGESMISITQNQNNYGELDGWAPGENIWCAGLNDSYGFVSGTSIASAITSAVVAANASWYFYSDGSKFENTRNWQLNLLNPTAVQSIALARWNLLDLSEEKYQDSKNVLVTITDKSSAFTPMPADELMSSHRAGTSQWGIRVFDPYNTSKIEIVDPLPDNFKLNPTGSIWGEPTLEQGPQDGEPYKLYHSSFLRTNSVTNEEELIKVKIYILSPNFQPNQISNDHELNILLQSICSFSGFFIRSCGPLYTSGSPCFDSCGGQYCCDQPPKEPRQCICI